MARVRLDYEPFKFTDIGFSAIYLFGNYTSRLAHRGLS
jgi:hypothetical protein